MEPTPKLLKTGPDSKDSSRQLCVAAVGCGVIWRHHLDIVAALKPRTLVYTAIVEPNAERRASAAEAVRVKFGAVPREFASLAEALSADVEDKIFEAVDIMIPNLGLLHEELAVEALRAKKHVILEKPISVSVASGERIIAAWKKFAPDHVLMCAENSQYWHEVVTAQQLIKDGVIGEILMARAKYYESAHPALNEWAADGSYEPGGFISEGDEGFVFDGGLHWLRPLRMLLGKATRVSARAGKTLPHMKGPGLTLALIGFEQGTSAVFESVLAPAAISDQPFFTIQGTKGEIVLDGFDGGGRLYTVKSGSLHEQSINEGFSGPVGWDTGYAGEMLDFVAAVLDGKTLDAGPEEAVEDLRLMLAMMKAAKTGRWECVAELEPETSMATLELKPS